MTNRKGGHDREERFRSLYQRFYRRVVRYLIRAFRFSEEDAEELAQEAFVRFYESMDEYRGDAEWTFFETIARRLAINRIRYGNTAKRNAKTVALDDPESNHEPPAPPEPDYADRLEHEDRRRRLYEAVDQLPPGQRQCMLLYLDEMTYEEIARAMRISLDAVRSRLRDAKRLLRSRLGDAHAFPEEGE